MSEDRAGVGQAVPAGGRGGGGSRASTVPLPMSGSVPLDTADGPAVADPADADTATSATGAAGTARAKHPVASPAVASAAVEAPAVHGSAVDGSAPNGDAPSAADGQAGQAPRGLERPTRRRSDPSDTAAPAAAAPSRGSARSGVRRARLALRRVDPWSVFVLSLLISVFLGIVLLVAVGLLYLLLEKAGVLSSVDTFARELSLIPQDGSIITAGRVMSVAAIVAAVDVVVLTVLATLGAVLYNVCASFTGGIEVTLAERE